AGRKAVLESDIYAPSPLAFNNSYKEPLEMSSEDINATIEAFKNAARRSEEADFDIIDIHAAHAYLINQFLSPLTNNRNDQYGGSRQNRFPVLKEIVIAVQTEWNRNPLVVRLSTNEYHEAVNTYEDFLYFTSELKALDVDL